MTTIAEQADKMTSDMAADLSWRDAVRGRYADFLEAKACQCQEIADAMGVKFPDENPNKIVLMYEGMASDNRAEAEAIRNGREFNLDVAEMRMRAAAASKAE